MTTNYHIGTSGWTYAHWRGTFYPENVPQKNWFAYYIKHFSTIELNATTYRHFNAETYVKWREQAPKNFQYIVKVPRLITHYKRLIHCSELIKEFWKSAELLEDKFGLMLLQLPPNFKYQPDVLAEAIAEFPDPKKLIVEFRNKIWYTEETKALLTNFKCIFCIADSPATKLTPWVTSSNAYIRMHGRTKWFDYNYSPKQLQNLKDFVLTLSESGVKNIYIMFNNDENGYAPHNAMYLEKLLK